VERFAAHRAPSDGDEGAFEVACRRSGRLLTVPPGRSLLQVAEAAGLTTLSACREGVCGTCETRVVEGIPEHRDAVLPAQARKANQSMMICVSRARDPRLVLDL
jgi:tetrachlorobenzoquinone reductase